jgi:TRAP-type mannitol/chloroaromatic compound transport system permease small subunit
MAGTKGAMAAASLAARLFDALLRWLNAFATLLVLGLMVLICADVVARGAFSAPIHGVPEIVKTIVPIMLWLQVAYSLQTGRHMRSGLGLRLMGSSRACTVLVVNAVAGVLLFGIIGYHAWDEFLLAWETGSWEGGTVRIPEWPAWLAVAVGAACTAVQYLRDAWRLLWHGPSAVDFGGEGVR